MFTFEKLYALEYAIGLADLVYDATRNFPEVERYGLTSQMRRAVVSVASNIAEGSSRQSPSDFCRFIEYAGESLFEVVTQAVIARNQQFLTAEDCQRIYRGSEEQSRILSGLLRAKRSGN